MPRPGTKKEVVGASWYSMTDLPAGRLRVRVEWSGRVFLATTGIDQRTGGWGWLVYRDGEIVYLPQPNDGLDPAGPTAWQPEREDLWPLPLPQPIEWKSRGSMSALTLAHSSTRDAELAAEVHEMREAARARGRHDDGPPDPPRWWLDPSRVTYSTPGSISKVEVEGRVMRALAGCGFGAPAAPRYRGVLNLLTAEADRLDVDWRAAQMEREAARFVGLQQDHTDFLLVMGWFCALGSPSSSRRAWSLTRRQRVLMWRAHRDGLPFQAIGDRLGITRQAAHALYARSLSKLQEIANSQKK